ncbi:hypothetical protein BASA81_000456 [Batrachochytrium salamandrivorans]|nr:hypothetical protein BASA81_000456 [Batrachochytrium salamandrivorans]
MKSRICCAGRRRKRATYPVSSIPPQYEYSLVRLEDVKRHFAVKEMRRKRQLTFQFEILFLCFFIPFSLFFICPLDLGAMGVLNFTPFALFPPSDLPTEFPNSVRRQMLREGYFADNGSYWQWMNNVLYRELFLVGSNATSLGTVKSTAYSSQVISQPVIVGAVRVRQIRVKPQPCPAMIVQAANQICYPAFSTSVEETAPVAGGMEYVANTGELEFVGKLATYPASGYVVDLASANDFLEMRSSFDIKSIVCVITTLTTFDPNSGLVSNIRVGIEFSNMGNTITVKNQVSRALYYRTDSDLLTMQVLQILVLVAEFWYVVFKLNQMGMFRSNPLSRIQIESPVWLAIDCVQLALIIYISYLAMPFLFLGSNQQLQQQVFQNNFFSGQGLDQLGISVLEMSGVILWLGACIVFKSTEYFKVMRLWHQVLNRIAWDALMFFLFIVVFCLGFVLCAWVTFGQSLQDYRSFGTSAFAVMNMLIMLVDYGAEKMSNEERKLIKRKWVRAATKLGARKTPEVVPVGKPSWHRVWLGRPFHQGFASNQHVLERLDALDVRKQCFLSFPKLVSLLMSDADLDDVTSTGGTVPIAVGGVVNVANGGEEADGEGVEGDEEPAADLEDQTATGGAVVAQPEEDFEGSPIFRTISHFSSYIADGNLGSGGTGGGAEGESNPAPPLHYHPLVVQASQVFEHFYLIPKDKPEVLSEFYKLEESMIEGEIQAKRACLVRLQTAT